MIRKYYKIFLVLFLYSGLPAQSISNGTTKYYRILSGNSEIYARVFKEGLASAFADNHMIEAADYHGKIIFDKDYPDSSSIKIEINAKTLSADNPEFRGKYGLKKLDSDDVKKINEHMLGTDQLDVENYPDIMFEFRNIKQSGNGKYEVIGNFSLHGVTHKVNFTAHIDVTGNKLFASGSFKFKQSDYGIEPYSIALGTIKNKDIMEVVFIITAVKDQDKTGDQ